MHVPAIVYLKYEVNAGFYVWMYRQSESLYCMCVFVCERERDSRGSEREFVTSKISEEQSQPLPSEALHEPINWLRVCATVCARAHTKVPMGLYERR